MIVQLSFKPTVFERRILAVIAEHYRNFDQLPTIELIKYDVEKQNHRLRQSEVRNVYDRLLDHEYVTGPGEFTGRYFTTEKFRQLLPQILFEGWEHEKIFSDDNTPAAPAIPVADIGMVGCNLWLD